MKDDFSSGLGQKKINEFSNGPGWQKRNEFSNRLISLGQQNKMKFSNWRGKNNNNNNVLDLGDSKCECANESFHFRIINKEIC